MQQCGIAGSFPGANQHPDDSKGYRVALIESFRRWGILPEGLRTLSEEQLRWSFPFTRDSEGWSALTEGAAQIRPQIIETLYIRDRRVLFEKLRKARKSTHDYLEKALSDSADARQRQVFNRVTGLDISRIPGLDITPTFEVHDLRPALRVTPSGTIMKQLIIILTQRHPTYIDHEKPQLGKFDFSGGATLIFDLEGEKPSLRYAVTRPIYDAERLARIRAYRKRKGQERLSLRDTYFGETTDGSASVDDEPLCRLHSEG